LAGGHHAQEFAAGAAEETTGLEALDDEISKLLAQAHAGAGGKAKAPASASKASINLHSTGKPAEMVVQGNYRLTDDPCHDVRHIILDAGNLPFPVLEGQSIGIISPGTDKDGKPHLPRLYSISSPRDGERPNYNNLSLTVKREDNGVCSNYICDLQKGDKVAVTGPFGSTFLMPSDPDAKLLMICTGTGSAPFRAFTMRRQRSDPDAQNAMTLVFGARTPNSLPYFGPLNKIPDSQLKKHMVFSRLDGQPKRYVQDELRDMEEEIAELLQDPNFYIYICGLRAMEEGVDAAMTSIAEIFGQQWHALRDSMREDGRYHVETY
jgi:benzoyl-CoA 2,3-dioxygenase component A